jgi:hypothetical protein
MDTGQEHDRELLVGRHDEGRQVPLGDFDRPGADTLEHTLPAFRKLHVLHVGETLSPEQRLGHVLRGEADPGGALKSRILGVSGGACAAASSGRSPRSPAVPASDKLPKN